MVRYRVACPGPVPLLLQQRRTDDSATDSREVKEAAAKLETLECARHCCHRRLKETDREEVKRERAAKQHTAGRGWTGRLRRRRVRCFPRRKRHRLRVQRS
jgi:hypothetical protein